MKRYKSYKDSGIEWLGEIPEHWKTTQMKRMFSFGKGLPITKSDLVEDGIPVISYGQIHSKNNTGTSTEKHLLRYIPESYVIGNESSSLSPGDFIFADTSEDIEGCGNCVYIDQVGIYAGYHTIIAKCLKQTNRYFAYLFLTDLWRSQIRSLVYGVKVFSITKPILSQAFLMVPPEDEQICITSFLDYKVGMINGLILEKGKQVEDLQQYRSSVISEAVTRGLNPNVELKESGIYWMGMIPCHWEILKIGYVLNNMDYLRQPIASENRERTNPQYDYYGASGVIDKVDNYNVDDEVLLIGEDGANLVIRNLPLIYKAKGKFWVNNHAHILKPIKDDYDYLAYLLEAADYSLFISGSAQPKLSQENLNKVYLCIPPLSEQKEIVDYLSTKIAKIDAIIKELKTQIEDIRKYKTSIIYEAVTGKIDLRDWKPN